MISFQFIKKKCKACGNERKFAKGTLRDQHSICGNCWWGPNGVEDPLEEKKEVLTENELQKVRKMLQKV